MKGTILVCLRDMLKEDKGMQPKDWQDILVASGLDAHRSILLASDVDDANALKMFGEAQQRYYKDFDGLADAYGRYWSVKYAPTVYASIYQGVRNTREFILKMDQVHVMVTRTMANSRPPRFTFDQPRPDTIVVNYASSRNLIVLFAGLARGLGEYFKEKIDVKVLNDKQVSIRFAA